MHSDFVVRPARRLITMSIIVLTVYSLLSILSAAVFTAVLINADNRDDRIYAGAWIGSTVVSWLFVTLLCFAADAIAHHIEYQAE